MRVSPSGIRQCVRWRASVLLPPRSATMLRQTARAVIHVCAVTVRILCFHSHSYMTKTSKMVQGQFQIPSSYSDSDAPPKYACGPPDAHGRCAKNKAFLPSLSSQNRHRRDSYQLGQEDRHARSVLVSCCRHCLRPCCRGVSIVFH